MCLKRDFFLCKWLIKIYFSFHHFCLSFHNSACLTELTHGLIWIVLFFFFYSFHVKKLHFHLKLVILLLFYRDYCSTSAGHFFHDNLHWTCISFITIERESMEHISSVCVRGGAIQAVKWETSVLTWLEGELLQFFCSIWACHFLTQSNSLCLSWVANCLLSLSLCAVTMTLS